MNSVGTTTGPDQIFTTAADPSPPPPVLGKAVNVTPVSGVVFIKLPPGKSLGTAGDGVESAALAKGQGFVPLTEARQIPTGSEIDSLEGSLRMVTSTGHVGKTQTATLSGGVYKVTQVRAGLSKGQTDFRLIERAFAGAPSYGGCSTAAAHGHAPRKVSKNTLNLLGIQEHGGKFRGIDGQAAATGRGTKWSFEAQCSGTLTHDYRGVVIVNDLIRHVTVVLHPGQSYLAKAIQARK